MTRLAIHIEGLGKEYRLGAREESYGSLRETLSNMAKAPFRRIAAVMQGHTALTSNETIWALKDVSADISEGEVVGVIGRNGAGKTTLLKILSRITEPTAGRAEIHGRVASLLEVGTGFHPELSGRDNIYLNGAILGMKREEIAAKFDEIVAFAEVTKFLDTQVKHYSSGMYLRLAFAVAAHLEPEVLLVDEVLAVGDASFQRRCIGKMSDVASSGRTVLFVSHNMEAVQRLCPRTIWIQGGQIAADGNTDEVVTEYLSATAAHHIGYRYQALPSAYPDDRAVLVAADMANDDGTEVGTFKLGEPLTVRETWHHRTPLDGAQYFAQVYDSRERLIFATNSRHDEHVGRAIAKGGDIDVVCRIADNVLVPGDYTVTIGCFMPPSNRVHMREHCLGFTVTEVPFDGEPRHINGRAIIAPKGSWNTAS